MEIGKGTVAVLASVCVVAGAAGTYVATRHGAAPAASADYTTTATGSTSPTDAATGLASAEASFRGPKTDGQPRRDLTLSRAERPSLERGAPVSLPPDRTASTDATRNPRSAGGEPDRGHADTAPQSVSGPEHEDRGGAPPIESTRVPEPVLAAPLEVAREEIVVPAQAVIGLQLETAVTSEKAVVEDEVIARVTRDVRVGDRVAILAGSKVHGFVTLVERGGRLRERARLGVRFTTLVLADGSRLPIDTETVYREGESATRESAAKIGGGAIGGAIIGGLLGGAKGAAIGTSIGAGAGTAVVMTGDRNAAVLNANTPITVRLEQPVAVAAERERR